MRPTRKLAHKALIAWLVYSLGFNPLLVAPAFAASTEFSDVPLPARKRPNPNLIFAVDDSGSMDGEVSIDANDGAAWYYTAGLSDGSSEVDSKKSPGFWGLNKFDKQQSGVPNFNRAGNTSGTWKKYVYLNPNGQCGSNCDTRTYPDASNDHFAIPPAQQFGSFRSPDFNKQYYNPAITYLPWKPYNDGTGACPSGTATGSGTTFLCTPGNADPKNAHSHPIYWSEAVDLTKDIPLSTSQGRYFRLYDGMRIIPGASYRICTGAPDGSGCGSWSSTGGVKCVGSSTEAETACQAGGVGLSSPSIDMNTSGRDHVDMALAYYPARVFISFSSTHVDPAQYTGFPMAFGEGPSGEQMRMVDIKSSTPTYPKAPGRTDCAGTSCAYAEEMQNFANWWQYYRKRHMSLSAAVGNALDGVRSLRSGYFLFNNRVNATMYDFDKPETTLNARRLIGLMYRTKGSGGTPTRDTLDWLGKQFQRTDSGAPITAACQFNGGFIITDGFATNSGPNYADYDGQTPAGNKYPTPADPTQDNYVYNQQFGVSPAQTAPYADKWSNTLADMAMKFYTENPRPTLPKGKVPVNTNDTSPNADRNANLHMNTYGLVLGLAGEIFANPSFPLQNADPFANPPDWNALTGGVEPRALQRDPRAIDELWHATLNGRGDMLKADSPEQTRNAVLDVVNKVVAKGGAAAAVSVSNANPIPGDNFTYQSSYNAGVWGGDLNVFEIDLATGEVKDTALWNPSAQKRLADKDWTTRKIATYNPATEVGVPFQWGSLTGTQQSSLGGLVVGSTAIQGQWVLDWLRGDRSRETTLLRSRGPRKDPATGKWTGGVIPDDVTVLGDVVNAEPIVVGPPKMNYLDALDAGYTTYKNGLAKSRQKAAYQATNDGMLHAFDAGTLIDPPKGLYSVGTGEELWAYVPSFGFQARQTGKAGLRTLADKEFFIHQFFVDGTPVSADVDLDKAGSATGSSPNWATIVVGGLAKGGRGWYALNVTDPTAVSEGALASKVMWEFPNAATASPNVGYSFGRPIVVKTRARGWVVAVTSGYENGDESGGDGRGHLFILNPATGAVIADLTTIDAEDGASSAANRQANPRGLTYVSAYVENGESDATVEAIYGGDLYGNVWKFDLSGATQGDWNVKRLATLTDGSGNRQPITSEPELALVGNHRVIYVGTGRYLGDKDIPGEPGAFVSATGTQTIYALKDDLTTTPTITGGRSDLFQRTVTKDLAAGTATVTPDPLATIANIFGSTKKGWFADLPETGERVITNPQLGLGVLTVTANIPDGTDPCIPGGRSWAYFLDYRTGGVIPGSTLGGSFLGQALASRVVLIKLPNGTMRALIRLTDATTESLGLPTPASSLAGKRKSWREIIVQ